MRIVKNGDVHVSVPFSVSDAEVKEFILKNQGWIEGAQARTAQRLIERDAFYAQLPLTTRAQWDEAQSRLDAIVQPLIAHYAPLMGVQPTTIFYRATISRWGCCYTNRRAICFSLYLLLLPTFCIEHVVVHELAHLLIPNHGPHFHAIMDRFYPRWKEAVKEEKNLGYSKDF